MKNNTKVNSSRTGISARCATAEPTTLVCQHPTKRGSSASFRFFFGIFSSSWGFEGILCISSAGVWFCTERFHENRTDGRTARPTSKNGVEYTVGSRGFYEDAPAQRCYATQEERRDAGDSRLQCERNSARRAAAAATTRSGRFHLGKKPHENSPPASYFRFRTTSLC